MFEKQQEETRVNVKRLRVDFAERTRLHYEQRRVVGEVSKARKMCRELDERHVSLVIC